LQKSQKIAIITSTSGKHGHFFTAVRQQFSDTLNRVARWVIFIPKDPNLGKFWSALEMKILVYFMTIWNILLSFGIVYGCLVYFVAI
jgi:hypothetical protein